MHTVRNAFITGCLLLALATSSAKAAPQVLPLAGADRLEVTVSAVRPGRGRASVPTLTVRTTRQFSCYDCEIRGSLKRRGRVLRVTLDGVACPSLCSLMKGPARKTIRLGVGPGVYALELAKGPRIDRWSLVISGQGISLTPVTTRFTAAPRSTTGQVPWVGLEVRCRWPATTKDPSVGPCERLYLAVAEIARPVLVAQYPARARNAFFSFTGGERDLERTVRPLLQKGLIVHLLLPRGRQLVCMNGTCSATRSRTVTASLQLDLIR